MFLFGVVFPEEKQKSDASVGHVLILKGETEQLFIMKEHKSQPISIHI